jgi:3-deoxy-D-manno-octulosonic-acid transferase
LGFIHQYVPIDQPKWVDAFLDYWKPDLALWVESELWPNLIDATAKRGTKLILLNAKMSAESFESWKKMKSFSQHVVQPFAMILAQNETYASYFRALGAPMVEVSGNLKFASSPLPCDELEFARLREQLVSRKMWLAASTHDPEEMIAGEIHKMLKNTYPQLLTTIAPRHPARADKIRQQLQNAGLQVAQRSRREAIGPSTDIYLADTMGELGLLFRLNHIVFMGNSLVAKGGHNLLEPARFGCAIVHGPNMQNFTDLTQQMQAANATSIVQTKEELMGKVDRLLYDAPMREELGRNAQTLAQNEDQVLNRVYARLIPFMGTATLPDEVQHARA